MPDDSLSSTPSAGVRFVTLNADDYGLSGGIDRGILDLAERGRVHAISCMSAMARWPAAAVQLRSLPGDVSVGLHLTLTALPNDAPVAGPSPPTDPSAGGLLARALTGCLNLTAITARIEAQLTRFEDALGRPPNHVDGHQHAHAMPGITGVLSKVLLERYSGALPWLRVTSPALPAAPGSAVRRLIIAGLGQQQRRALQGSPFLSNSAFGGIRGFAESLPYGALLERQLANAADKGTLIMCHPATAAPLAGDPIAAAREAEFAFLAGGGLDAALGRANCHLRPLVPRRVEPLRRQ